MDSSKSSEVKFSLSARMGFDENHKISVSVGVVLKCSEDGMDFESLYHNADLCTYESKKSAGNTFTIYE